MSKPRITARVPDDVHERATLAAEIEGQSLNQWMIEAIVSKLESLDDETVRAHLERRYKGLLSDNK